MIGGLQGEFGDLDIKYLKQNISKCRSHIRDLDIKYLKQNISKYLKMSVAHMGKLQENTAALCKMAAKLSE